MDERVETRTDASMEDLTELRPTALPPRPQRKFLGVQVPLVDSVPNFHHWGPKNKRKRERRAIEVLGEEETDEGQFVFVFYEDNSVKRVSCQLNSAPLIFCSPPFNPSLTLDRLRLAASLALIALSGTRIVCPFSFMLLADKSQSGWSSLLTRFFVS